jgi:UPF0755 protein
MLRFAVLTLLVGLFALALIVGGLFLPYRGFTQEVFLDFPRGTTTQQMGKELARAGIIRYSWQFSMLRAAHPGAKLQAGEYRFSAAANVTRVFDRIARGDVYYYEITVPEGSNIFDIAAIAAASKLMTASAFVNAAADAKPIADLDPRAVTLEGYLFPSTYRITRRTTAEQLARLMVDQFRNEWRTLAADLPSAPNVHDMVTLASLVEKETAVPKERREVASVYSNRLRIGMKLDCDPTTIYAALLEDRYRGKLHRSDLASLNSYNTYRHAGLPPGPIANPGIESLRAALAPAKTEFLYFVAKPGGSGSHTFSADFAAHEKAVQAYRRGQPKTGTSH